LRVVRAFVIISGTFFSDKSPLLNHLLTPSTTLLSCSMVQGSTFHFNRGLNLFPAIDHIGGSDGISPVGKTFSVRGRFDGEWATDHYPVVGDFAVQ
jgi:hypothetical protein